MISIFLEIKLYTKIMKIPTYILAGVISAQQIPSDLGKNVQG